MRGILLEDSFGFDGAPDPRPGFRKHSKFLDPSDFEVLRERADALIYKVPADINPQDFNEVYIGCRKYSVPLGVAQIN